jgi:uncharacterized membrane protein YbhN (UPF0104 family)
MLAPGPANSRTRGRLSRVLRIAIAVAVLGAAGFILHREFSSIKIAALVRALHDTAPWRIVCALALTALSFASVSTYDLYAARLVAARRISTRHALFAGVVGNAIANTLGFHAVTATVVRFRIYASVGLSASDLAKIISLQGASIIGGFVCVTALSLLCSPTNHGGVGRLIGAGLLALAAGVLLWLYWRRRQLSIGRWTLPFPDAKSAAQQMAIGTLEMSAAIGALYVLLPGALTPNFFDLVLAYMGALLLGIVSGAPGGVGVFEATLLVTFAASDRPSILAALLLYRLSYNILPFCLSSLALLAFERRRAVQGSAL